MKREASRPKILIVEDNKLTAQTIMMGLNDAGYDDIQTAENAKDALRILKHQNIDLVLMDIMLPGKTDGIEIAREIKARRDIPVIFITGYDDESTINRVLESDQFGFVKKPFSIDEVLVAIEIALQRYVFEKKLQNSKKKFETIFNLVNDGILYVNSSGQVLDVNKSFEKITGISREYIVGKMIPELIDEFISSDNQDKVREAAKQFLEGKEIESLEIPYKDRYLNISSSQGDKEPGSIVLIRDITSEQKMQETLRVSEKRYRTLVEHSPAGIALIDEDFRFLFANDSIADILGLEQEKIIGRDIRDFMEKRSVKEVNKYYHNREKIKDAPKRFEIRIKRDDGSRRWLEVSSTYLELADGSLQIVVQLIDITQRKQTEEALIEQNRLFMAGPTVVVKWSEAVKPVLYVSPNVENILGYSQDEFLSRKIIYYDIVHPEDRERMVREVREFIATRQPYFEQEYRLRHRNGHYLWMHDFTIPEYNRKGVAITFTGHIRDISAQKKAELLLRESEEKYRKIIENTLEGIYITQKHILRFCNQKFAEMFGFGSPEEIIGKHVKELVAPESWELVDEMVKKREEGESQIAHYNFQARKKEGTIFTVEVLGSRIMFKGKPAIQGVMRDISEKIKLEDQLRQSQKLEAIGQLAAGVAHDFNNILTAILGSADLALLQLPENHSISPELEEIRKSVDKAANLTRKLLAFSKQQIINPVPLQINSVISDMYKMLRRLIGEDIALKINLNPDLPVVMADPGQIEQILVNLVVNARDAINEQPRNKKEKEIRIETFRQKVDDAIRQTHADLGEGEYVIISVSDTGIGIKQENLSRIFDPFFTTKKEGKGSGMGLSTVYGIIRQNKGNIYVYSEPGIGTTFKIFWPVITKAEIIEKKEESKKVIRGKGKVLLVEDDESVRRVVYNILSGLGYETIIKENGKEALEFCRKTGTQFDLLLTDVVMPKMGGIDLADNLKKIIPSLKILFMSGYTDNLQVRDLYSREGLFFISKPFTKEKMSQKIREILKPS